MRLVLANTLRTRADDHTKDARTINAYPEGGGDAPMLRKRPGCEPTGFDFTTPLQGFSSIADLLTPLPYGEWSDVGNLMVSISGDSFGITDISPTTGGIPVVEFAYFSQAFAAGTAEEWAMPWPRTNAFVCSDTAIYQFSVRAVSPGRKLLSSNDGGASWVIVNAMDELVADTDGDPTRDLLGAARAIGLHQGALFVTGNFPDTLASTNGGVSFSAVGSTFWPTNDFLSPIVSDGTYMYGCQPRLNGFNFFKSANGSSWLFVASQYADSNAKVKEPVFHGGVVWVPFFEYGTGKTRVATYSAGSGVENHDLSGAENGETLHLVSDGTNLYAYENFTASGIRVYAVNVADYSLTEIYSNASLGYSVFDISSTNAFFYDSKIFIPVHRGDNSISLYSLTVGGA